MHEDAPILEASKRERLGSRYSRRVRDGGGLPAVVYGHKAAPQSITLDLEHTVDQIEGGDRVFRLAVGGGDPQLVLVKALQFDYLGTNVVHADFARVELDERVRSRVPIRFVGEAKGLSAAGAMMMHPNTEIEIECAIRDLPGRIDVDMSDLDVDMAITCGDIKLPGKTMRLVGDPHAIVAQVRISKGAAAAAAADEEEGEGTAEGEEGGEAAPEEKAD